jgi:hypothetical protein
MSGTAFFSIGTNLLTSFPYPCASIVTRAAGVPSLIVKYPSNGGNDCNSPGITVCTSRICSLFDTDRPINPCCVSLRVISIRSCLPIKSAITSAVFPSRQFRINFVQVPLQNHPPIQLPIIPINLGLRLRPQNRRRANQLLGRSGTGNRCTRCET